MSDDGTFKSGPFKGKGKLRVIGIAAAIIIVGAAVSYWVGFYGLFE